MRKITSKRHSIKKAKNRGRALGILLIIVMFGSVFGAILGTFHSGSQESPYVDYGEHRFFYSQGLWHTSFENAVFSFSNFPGEVSLEAESIQFGASQYVNLPLYIYSEHELSYEEVVNNLAQISERVQPVCVESRECLQDLPVKDCSNNLIIIELSESKEISSEQNCVYIKGNEMEILEMTDSFLFKILGIH